MGQESFRPTGNAGSQGKSQAPTPTVPDLAKTTPLGAGTGIMKGSDVSTLLNTMKNGNIFERRHAIAELANMILDKDGDIHVKRGLLRFLYESTIVEYGPIVVGAIIANEAGVKALLELATPSPRSKTRIDDSASAYLQLIERYDREVVFAIAADSLFSPDDALLVAMKARGVRQGFEDAVAFANEVAIKSGITGWKVENSFIYTLLNPPGQIPQNFLPRHLDHKIREFLGA